MSAVTDEKRIRIDKLPDSNALNQYQLISGKNSKNQNNKMAEDVSNSGAWSRWEGK